MRALVPVAALAALLAWPGSAGAAAYTGSEAERAARKTGRRVVRELDLDLDGRAPREIAVAERLRGGRLVVRILRPTEEDDVFETVLEGTPQKADRVARFEARPMVGSSRPELVAVFDTKSPDETARALRIVGHDGRKIVELMAETFLVSAERPPEGRFVTLGEVRPHFVFANVRGDEAEEVVFVTGAQTLRLPGRSGQITYAIGAYRDVYAYAEGRFTKVASREVVSFTDPKPVSKAKASAQVPKIWGTAQPFWGADGDLETSWNVPLAEAEGQTLTVRLKGAPAVKLVRVVPGCGGAEYEWDRHGQIEKFTLALGSGVRIEVDRGDVTRMSPAVEAMAEFPLEEGFGAQLLIALRDPAPLPWARLEIDGAVPGEPERGKPVPEVCLSEISFH